MKKNNKLMRIRGERKELNIYIINLAALLWILSLPFSAFGGMYIEQPKVSFLFYMIIAYCYVINKKFKKIL